MYNKHALWTPHPHTSSGHQLSQFKINRLALSNPVLGQPSNFVKPLCTYKHPHSSSSRFRADKHFFPPPNLSHTNSIAKRPLFYKQTVLPIHNFFVTPARSCPSLVPLRSNSIGSPFLFYKQMSLLKLISRPAHNCHCQNQQFLVWSTIIAGRNFHHATRRPCVLRFPFSLIFFDVDFPGP